MGAKKYVLFVISDKPIVSPTDIDGVQHLINEEIEVVGSNFFTLGKELPNHMNLRYSNQTMYGESGDSSGAIVSWLDCVVSCSGYIPFYRKLKEEKSDIIGRVE